MRIKAIRLGLQTRVRNGRIAVTAKNIEIRVTNRNRNNMGDN